MVFSHHDYTAGWISALPVEMAAAKAMMDKPLHPHLPQVLEDTNNYTLGRIGSHNVVLVCLPRIGTNSAAHAAANLLRSFPNIRFGLMVGVGGGVPGPPNINPLKDIRLGDVVVGCPENQHGGVIQYDLGTTTQKRSTLEFVRKGHLNKPPAILLGAIQSMQADSMMEPLSFHRHYDEMLEKYPTMAMEYQRPEVDQLYVSKHVHKQNNPDCTKCSDEELIHRQPRAFSVVHYGLIGSANQVLKNAVQRDRLYTKEKIICFEMEAAGFMDEFSCIVIRGICDYCDSHKSKQWQPYSSAIAAAFGKELLFKIPPTTVEKLPQLTDQNVIKVNSENSDGRNDKLANMSQKGDISVEKYAACFKALKCIHPRFDKTRLEDVKGGLLEDVYRWILDTREYNTWLSDKGLLWIKGNPGKGKTMLMCGIINEIAPNTSYFFCQATIDTNNTATHILRGLILGILEENRSLAAIIYDKIERANDLPEDSAFYVLKEIIEDMLAVHETTIMIDALDECLIGLDKLLRFISKASTSYSSRWLVTSRNIAEICEVLEETSQISLELNDHSVAEAVNIFIKYKVQELTRVKRYDVILCAFVLQYLMDNAKGTFLWVSLVCLNLSKKRPYDTKNALLEYPSGLESLYKRMLTSIEDLSSAHKLKQILAIVCVTFRPISLEELSTLIESDNEAEYNVSWIQDMVNNCGSFLTIRDSVVQFVHQSAKDFLVLKASKHIFPDGEIPVHQHVFTKSLQCLQNLSRNMYGIKEPGAEIDSIVIPTPDPLAKMKYACVYWHDHFLHILDSSTVFISSADTDLISNFFTTKYLYWLEALSLLQNIYPALLAITKLVNRFQDTVSQAGLANERPDVLKSLELMSDALQCLRYFQYALTRSPLQVYVSVLLFSPVQSLVRHNFSHETPRWVVLKEGLRQSWPTSLNIDATGYVGLRWSSDGQQIAIRGGNQGLRVLNALSGQVLCRMYGRYLHDYVFSNHGPILKAIRGHCSEVQSYLVTTGQLLETIQLKDSSEENQVFHHQSANSFCTTEECLNNFLDATTDQGSNGLTSFDLFYAVFSQDATLVACARMCCKIIHVHSTDSGALTQKFACRYSLGGLKFSPDNMHLAGMNNTAVYIWNIQSGSVVWRTSLTDGANIAFSPCSKLLAISQFKFELWHWQENRMVYSFDDESFTGDWSSSRKVAFNQDGESILISYLTLLHEWVIDGTTWRVRGSFDAPVNSIAVCENGQSIAASDTNIVKIWHADKCSPKSDERFVVSPVFVGLYIIHGDVYGIANIPETVVYRWLNGWEYDQNFMISLGLTIERERWKISPDRSRAAFFEYRNTPAIEVWDLSRGYRMTRLQRSETEISAVCWGPGDAYLTICDAGLSAMVLYHIQTGQDIDQWACPSAYNNSARDVCTQWSEQGEFLAMAHRSGLDLWNNQHREWKLLYADDPYGWSGSQLQFSDSGSLLVTLRVDRALQIFRTDNQAMVLCIPKHCQSFHLSIDENWLKTDRGHFTTPGGFLAPDQTVLRHPAVHLNMERDHSLDRSWIRCGSKNIIWLPQDFRPPEDAWDIVESTVAIMVEGSPVILEVTWDPSKDFDSQAGTKIELTSKRRGSTLVLDERPTKKL